MEENAGTVILLVSFLYNVNSSSSQASEKPRASVTDQEQCVLDNTSVSYQERSGSNFCLEIRYRRAVYCHFQLVSRTNSETAGLQHAGTEFSSHTAKFILPDCLQVFLMRQV